MRLLGDMRQGVGWKNLSILAASLAVAGIWLAQAPSHDRAEFPMPQGKTYMAECGACHTAYAPGLLPARSWSLMMEGLDDHFGEDASLAEPARLAILKSLEDLAADGDFADARSRRIVAGIANQQSPARFTQTDYFKVLHDELPAGVWRLKEVGSAANCLACHPQANSGRYGEGELRVPPIQD